MSGQEAQQLGWLAGFCFPLARTGHTFVVVRGWEGQKGNSRNQCSGPRDDWGVSVKKKGLSRQVQNVR